MEDETVEDNSLTDARIAALEREVKRAQWMLTATACGLALCVVVVAVLALRDRGEVGDHLNVRDKNGTLRATISSQWDGITALRFYNGVHGGPQMELVSGLDRSALSFRNPTRAGYQMQLNANATGDSELSFWDSNRTVPRVKLVSGPTGSGFGMLNSDGSTAMTLVAGIGFNSLLLSDRTGALRLGLAADPSFSGLTLYDENGKDERVKLMTAKGISALYQSDRDGKLSVNSRVALPSK